jgi:histidine triad (HIT) family protein
MDIYCDQVLSGKLPVRKVAETEDVVAFHHTQPYWPVHLVVIPKRHIGSLATMEPDDVPVVNEMLQVAAELCRKVTREHGGCRLSTNSGDYQSTRHLHFYIHHGPRLRNEDGSPEAPTKA